MFQQLSKILPGGVRRGYKNLLAYCDIDIEPDKFAGMTIIVGIVLSFIMALNLSIALQLSAGLFLIILFTSYAAFHLLVYMWLVLRADAKGRYVENVLPDALLLMAMNIKSGMTTDRALIMTGRPEFGPLEKELNRAGKQVLAGKPIKHALIEISYRIKSTVLERTMSLIVEGIESGGELSNLLQQTSEEIQNNKIVQSEVRANIMMYAIFIFFAAAIGAPLLFGVSTYLVGNIGQQSAVLQSMNSAQGSEFKITQNFLLLFSILSLMVTSLFGSLIIGIIKGGQEKAGLKFIPMMLGLSLIVFFAIRTLVASILPAY